MKDLELKRNAEWYNDPTAYHGILNALKGEKDMAERTKHLRGEMWEFATKTGDQQRRCVVVSNNDRAESNFVSIVVVYERAMSKRSVTIRNMTEVYGYADAEMLSYARHDQLTERVGIVPEFVMRELEDAILSSLGMEWNIEEQKGAVEAEVLRGMLEETEAIHKEELAQKDEAIAELTSLYEKELIAQKDVPMLIAERDVYKKMYQELLERMIAR